MSKVAPAPAAATVQEPLLKLEKEILMADGVTLVNFMAGDKAVGSAPFLCALQRKTRFAARH
jgi:hypothetical protein